jgi:hypothetical protein
MKTFHKINLLLLVVSITIIKSVFAEITMKQQFEIINQLKTQEIEPDKIYYQIDFNYFSSKENSFTQQKLYSTIDNALDINSSKNPIPAQKIAQIKLNNNYQYYDVLKQDRNIIEILYPTEPFETLEDGIHYYILDKYNRLQKKENFKDVFEEPCYLRVEKLNGKVISIQKRPISSISHFSYDYWPNQNLKHIKLEIFNNQNNMIYLSEKFYDENGNKLKGNQHNLLTQQTMSYTEINKDHIERIEEYFDNNGIKTNSVTYFDKSKSFPRIENKQFNSKGKIIKITGHNPDEIFDDAANDLVEPYPYNTLMMDVEKTSRFVTRKLFKHTLDKNTKQWDNEAINRTRYLEIKPNKTYYAKLPYPYFLDERYKNFPHQKPLTLIEAENQQSNVKYYDLIKFEVGDNYQYKTLIKEKWQQTPITLPLEQFKPLENDIYFFVMDNNGKLSPLENVEQAVERPNYIRVEKEMGKIISIVKKTRIYKVLNEFEYQDNSLKSSKFFVLESLFLPHFIIESKYEDKKNIVTYQQIKNSQGIIIRIYNYINKDQLIAVSDRFDDNGIRTNHLELKLYESYDKFYEKNQFFDEKGNLIFTIDDSNKENKDNSIIKGINTPQPYDKLPFIPDMFEEVLFDIYLEQLKAMNNNEY